MTTPTRFSARVDDPPALLHASTGRWFQVADRLACATPGGTWLAGAGSTAFVPGEALSVRPGRRTLAIRTATTELQVGLDGEVIRSAPRALERFGEEVRVKAIRGRWVALGGATALPDVVATRDPRPYPIGDGVAWRADRMLYRASPAGVRAASTLPRDGEWSVGPEGALVIGADRVWSAAGAPGRTPTPLPRRLLQEPWGLRWSDDGQHLAGIDAVTGEAVRVDLRRRAHEVMGPPGACPVGVAAHLAPDGRITSAQALLAPPLLRAVPACCARRGALLAGPGGVAWDLSDGTPLFDEPVFANQATVASPEGPWPSVEWHTGRGCFVEPRTGRRSGSFFVPLDDGEAIVGGAWRRGPVFFTDEGRGFRLRPGADRAEPWPARPPLRQPRCVAGVPVDGAAPVGGVLYGWTEDGLLVADAVTAARTRG